MELYTTLTRVKQSLNGGVLPPMTPLTEKAKKLIDPAFVEGMGGLVEDAKKGLRCPIRGCGQWTHHLTHHLHRAHAAISVPAVREALSIAPGVGLTSKALKRRASAARREEWRALSPVKQKRRLAALRGGTVLPSERSARSSATRRRNLKAIGTLNLHVKCPAQIAERYVALREQLGREPTCDDDIVLRKAAEALYRTWNGFKANMGVGYLHKVHNADDVCDSFREYFNAHGHLPSEGESRNPDRLPLFPGRRAVVRVLGVSSWGVAMSHIAWTLGVHCPRFSPLGGGFLTVNDVSARTGAARITVRKWCQTGVLRGSHRVADGSMKAWRIPESALVGFTPPAPWRIGVTVGQMVGNR